MYRWWNIQKQPNGHFKIWADDNDERPMFPRNEAELEANLEDQSIFEDQFEDVLGQLAKGGTARIKVLKLGTFSQGLPF